MTTLFTIFVLYRAIRILLVRITSLQRSIRRYGPIVMVAVMIVVGSLETKGVDSIY